MSHKHSWNWTWLNICLRQKNVKVIHQDPGHIHCLTLKELCSCCSPKMVVVMNIYIRATYKGKNPQGEQMAGALKNLTLPSTHNLQHRLYLTILTRFLNFPPCGTECGFSPTTQDSWSVLYCPLEKGDLRMPQALGTWVSSTDDLPSRCPGWCRRGTGGRVWAWTCTAMEGFDFSVAEAIRNPVSGDWHCECEEAGPEPPFSWFGSRLRWSGPETNICVPDSPSWCRSGSRMGSSWYSSDLSLEAQPRVSSWPSD